MLLLEVTILLILMSHAYQRKPGLPSTSRYTSVVASSSLLVRTALRCSTGAERSRRRSPPSWTHLLAELPLILLSRGCLGKLINSCLPEEVNSETSEKHHFIISDENKPDQPLKTNSETISAKTCCLGSGVLSSPQQHATDINKSCHHLGT